MNAISRKYFQSKSITTALFLAMILFFFFFLFDFFVYFPAEIHSVCIDNIMKKCRIPFIFSISGLFIHFHVFI